MENEATLIMSSLISRLLSPSRDIDVDLQPLVDELKELWQRVETYDVSTNHVFQLHAAFISIINNFLRYISISG